jgi:PleD family two-component response regulator
VRRSFTARRLAVSVPCETMSTNASTEDAQTPSRSSVLLIDDHPLFCAALRLALRAKGFDAHQLPVTERNGILAAAARFPAGVVLLDLNLGLVRRVVSSVTVRCGTLRYACGAVGTAGRGS